MIDVNKDFMDRLDIFELRVGNMDGLNIRVGGKFSIKRVPFVVTAILRVYVGDNKEYHIFGSIPGEEDQLLKVIDGMPVYYTVDVHIPQKFIVG